MRATRVFVISDLHLGGAAPAMMSHADDLASFIDGLPDKLQGDEALELVIAGDFIDFLAIALDGEQEAWTATAERAVRKLDLAMKGADRPVYDALSRLVGSGHRLTVIVGNHDLELAVPSVQQAFCENLETTRHRVVFVDDGQAWRIGNALIEHGNRYDGANVNDWGGLRAIVSAWSRGESAPSPLEVSAGSQIVEHVVNPLKARYAFIDILQPQGELLGYLLLAMEPALRCDFASIRRLLVGGIARALARKIGPPRKEEQVGAEQRDDALVGKPLDTEALDGLLGVKPVGVSERDVAASDWIREFLRDPDDSLARFLSGDTDIPDARLTQLQNVIAEMTRGDDTLNTAGDTEQYGRNAARLRKSAGVDVVVMGHTHKPKTEPQTSGKPVEAFYINTGTWVDSIAVPPGALERTAEGKAQLEQWLRDVYHDRRGVRGFHPHWADLRVEPGGQVSHARLCTIGGTI